MATASADGNVHIYDFEVSEKAITKFQAHKGPCWRVAWADPKFGNYFATCGFDTDLKIWKEISMNKWEKEYSYSEHEGSVNCVAFGPWELDFKLAACSSDGTISMSIWGRNGWLTQKYQTPHLGPINAVTWAPTSNYGHMKEGTKTANQLLASCGCDKKFVVYNFNHETKTLNSIFVAVEAHKEWIRDISWNPSILGSIDQIATASEDHTVKIWRFNRFSANDEVREEKNPENYEEMDCFGGCIWRCSWNSYGTMLAASYTNDRGNNMVHIIKENDEGKWEPTHQIEV